MADEFRGGDLGDARRAKRLPALAATLARFPAASIPAACRGWAETIAAYRLLGCEDFAPEALVAPHREATAARCAAHRCVAVIQDSTEMDFSHLKCATGLGPLNDHHRRGFFLHSLQALSEDGVPLGMWGAQVILRDDATFRSTATRKRKPICEKESRRWLDGYLAASELARRLPQREIVSISDREGDIYEVFAAWAQAAGGPRAEWLIRANQDRALDGVEEGDPAKLFAALAAAPALGEVEFEMKARRGTRKVKGSTVVSLRSARTVRQTVRVLEISPRPPFRKGGRPAPVTFRAVLAEETDPPAGQEPVRWLLLTSLPVKTLKDARRIIRLYLRRWDIEVFHRVLKTGCRVERLQLKSGRALINAVMIYAVIAWRILWLTRLGRQCPDLPCGIVFDEAEWKSACAVVKRPATAGEPTLGEFIKIVGKLGGHLGRKGDGPPGPQSVWLGLARVRDFACAWRALHGG